MSAWVGLCELALGGCTTTTDHLYVHPRGGGDLISAEIAAAQEVGLRFHPTRGSMSLGEKDGAAAGQRGPGRRRDPGRLGPPGGAPSRPGPGGDGEGRVGAVLAVLGHARAHGAHRGAGRAARRPPAHPPGRGCRRGRVLPRSLRLPTDRALRAGGLGTDRAWVAHCVFPDQGEIARLGAWGTGVAHCPSSSQLIGAGLAPVRELRTAGVPVGLGCDGSASTDCASLWLEASALLLARLRHGPEAMSARMCWRWRRWVERRAWVGRARSGRSYPARRPTWSSGRSPASLRRRRHRSGGGLVALRSGLGAAPSSTGPWSWRTVRSSTMVFRRCWSGTAGSPRSGPPRPPDHPASRPLIANARSVASARSASSSASTRPSRMSHSPSQSTERTFSDFIDVTRAAWGSCTGAMLAIRVSTIVRSARKPARAAPVRRPCRLRRRR